MCYFCLNPGYYAGVCLRYQAPAAQAGSRADDPCAATATNAHRLQQRRWQLGLLKGLPRVGSIFGLHRHLILPQVLLGSQLCFFLLLLLLICISCNADICV